MNPFLTNSMPIDSVKALFNREQYIKTIKEFVDWRVQTVIVGVEGVGKTSLLNTVFNREYRIQKAKEMVLISPVTEFPSNLTNADIYNHFIDTILSSVDILSFCGEDEKRKTILSQCEVKHLTSQSKETEFQNIVDIIHDEGYHIVIVVDNFERFTSSKEVTMKHHETLRRMLTKTQYIVATNYDLNEDSLPKYVSGSFYLMNFAGHEIRIGGWSYEQTAMYINDQLKMSDIKFSETTIFDLYNATGGIPALVKIAGKYAYEYIEKNRTEDNLKFVPLYNDKKVQLLLQHWSKMLTPTQIEALRKIQYPYSALDEAMLRCLYLRGLLEYAQKKDAFGNIIVKDDEYQYCCKYFGKFCKDKGMLEAAALQNPLKMDQVATHAKDKMSIEELIDELKKRIEDGAASKEQLLSITKSLCQFMPDVTGTIDLNEELDDEILSKYLLSKEYLDKFDTRVQKFLYVGIQMDRCFANVTRSDFDFSPVYLSFCKAAELHLNLTIVPMMKKASPNATDQYGNRISLLPAEQSLMMGVIYTILTKHQIGIDNRVIDVIKQRCRVKQLTKYPDTWWNSFEKTLKDIKVLRNDCPHTSMLQDASGTNLLQKLFGNEKNSNRAFNSENAEKSFMMKCLNVHKDFMSTFPAE